MAQILSINRSKRKPYLFQAEKHLQIDMNFSINLINKLEIGGGYSIFICVPCLFGFLLCIYLHLDFRPALHLAHIRPRPRKKKPWAHHEFQLNVLRCST